MKKFLLKVIRAILAFIGFFKCQNKNNQLKDMHYSPINYPSNDDLKYLFPSISSPIFIPKKHTKLSYAQVRRVAKKRRQKRKYGYK